MDTGFDAACVRNERGGELGGNAVLDVHPFDADAGLATVGEGAPGNGLGRRRDIGIRRHDDRILAAALHHHRCESLGARRHDLRSGSTRTGERDLVDPSPAQRSTGFTETGHQRQHASG